MRRFTTWLCLLLATASFSTPSFADAPTGTLTFKFVYITFPDMDPELQSITPEQSTEIFDRFSTWMTQESDDTITPVMVLLDDPNNPGIKWMADQNGLTYRNYAGAPKDHEECWANHPYGYVGGLQAEILDEVWAAYQGTGVDPFEGTDYLVFVTDDYPGGWASPLGEWIDGIGILSLVPDCASMPYTDGIATHFPSQYPSQELLQGFIANWQNVEKNLFFLAHEWGHNIGLNHTAGSTTNSNTINPDSYQWGVYSTMRAESIESGGAPAYALHDQVQLGWLDEPFVVTKNLRNAKVFDIRLPQAKILEIPLEPIVIDVFGTPYSIPQSFWLSYHSGLDEDGAIDGTGQAIYPSQGLAVWHRMGGVWDLESAFGRWNVIGDPNDPTTWSDPAPTSGYDNMDYWVGRDYIEYRDYKGSEWDFFNLGYKSEFSFRSNPSSFGMSDYSLPQPFEYFRHFPHTRTNSVMVEIKEDFGDYLIVDILLAPYENIITPNGGEFYWTVDTVPIRWEYDETKHLTSVQIYLSRDDGVTYSPTPLWSGPASNEVFNWHPTPADASNFCKIKIVYANDLSNHVGEDESDESFTVHRKVYFEDPIFPENGRMEADRYVVTRLLPAFPNPANPTTVLRFELANAGRADLSIYNVRGQLVKRLVDQDMGVGEHTFRWDGTDREGATVPGGVYFARLTTATEVHSQRVTFVK